MSNHYPPARRAGLHAASGIDRSRVLDTLVNNLEGMAYRCLNDAQWTMIFVSRGCLDLTGFSPSEFLDNAISWEGITHEEDRDRVRTIIAAALGKHVRFAVQYRITTRAGEVKWVSERGVGVVDETGQPVIEGFIEDISAHRASIEATERAELRYRHIFEHALEGIFQTTSDGRYLAANPALAQLYGYASPAELIADLGDLDHRLYVENGRREEFRRLMNKHGEVRNFESEVFRRDGSRLWISENAHSVFDAQGRFICYEGTVQDISERKEYQRQLERQANYDRLTGLPNRQLLTDRLEQGLARADRLGYFLALVFIDLDHFKFINDSLGHAAGDELLMQVAERLTGCLRTSDTVARLGGDEFVLVINDHYRVGSLISVLERVLAAIGQPIMLGGREFQVGASLGVALYPNDGEDSATLLKHADIAMYAAKSRGRNTFEFFTKDLNRLAEDRLTIEAAMRASLERDEFEVHYQPKVDAERRVVGVEALARWVHPELGPVSPDRFIPVAEDTGLILPLTLTILRRAFKAAAAWNLGRSMPLRVAVNLSPRLFLGPDIVGEIGTLLREASLSADLIELEITETVFLGDSERTIGILQQLKEFGFELAMDDFGTGYSSLSYLRRLPLDIIKIDRSLVTDIEQVEESAMIAHAVVSLGHSLHKCVVAEGVENEAQFDFLRRLGCDEFQGYLISPPLPPDRLQLFLTENA